MKKQKQQTSPDDTLLTLKQFGNDNFYQQTYIPTSQEI